MANNNGNGYQNRYAVRTARKLRLLHFDFDFDFNEKTNEEKPDTTIYASNVYRLPEGVTMQDAYKILSFLTEKVEKTGLEKSSRASIRSLESMLGEYGFVEEECGNIADRYWHKAGYRIQLPHGPKEVVGVVDLMTIIASSKNLAKEFENWKGKERYFDWFQEGVTQEDIDVIYNKDTCDEPDGSVM